MLNRDVIVGRTDRELLKVVDTDLKRAARLAGARLACRAGCTECCVGPFAVNRLDAWRLRQGFADLARRAPAEAVKLTTRVRAAVRRLCEGYPGDVKTGRLEEDDEARDRFFEKHRDLVCPVLDPVTGLCRLYAYRPLSCRTFGPPVRIGTDNLPPCRLCFVEAAADGIEACRVEPDRDDLEGMVLRLLDAPGDGQWETVIAFALGDCRS